MRAIANNSSATGSLCCSHGPAAKWLRARTEALAEFHHPVLCCFIGLVPVSTALAGIAIRPYMLATSFVRLVANGAAGPVAIAAPYVFAVVNLVIVGIAAGTVWLARGAPAAARGITGRRPHAGRRAPIAALESRHPAAWLI